MRQVLFDEENDLGRTFAVFFYGLNMDADLLSSRGVVPRDPRIVFIDGFMVKLGKKAMLLRVTGARAYGMSFRLTHGEVDLLYKDLDDYRAEPFLAVCANGEVSAVVSMVHINPPIYSNPIPDYASRWNDLAAKLGLPSATATNLGGSAEMGSRPTRRYEGSCHCGVVRFEIETDFPELTMCDCSICRRKNALMVKVHESNFKLIAGGEALTEYRFHTKTARHFFCNVCGVYPFHRKRVTPDNLGINVYCLHDFDPAGIPVRQAIGAAMP